VELHDATFDRSATAFDDPGRVDIVIDNHRWPLGLASGDSGLDEFRLASIGKTS
jgi:hypothetical protein